MIRGKPARDTGSYCIAYAHYAYSKPDTIDFSNNSQGGGDAVYD